MRPAQSLGSSWDSGPGAGCLPLTTQNFDFQITGHLALSPALATGARWTPRRPSGGSACQKSEIIQSSRLC